MRNIALLDGDMYVYKACAAVEEEIHWGGGLVTLHSYSDKALEAFDTQLTFIKNMFAEETLGDSFDEIRMCFSGSGKRFRNDILESYKENRKSVRKPLCYGDVKDYIEEVYSCFEEKNLEGDDLLGILATSTAEGPDTRLVMVSGDKDMLTVPAWYLDTTRGELHKPDTERSHYRHMYQTLIGDQTDGYSGCPGVGPKKADAALSDPKLGVTLWERVVKTYEKFNLTERDALIQARIAYILRSGDYNWDTGKVRLWNPEYPEVS